MAIRLKIGCISKKTTEDGDDVIFGEVDLSTAKDIEIPLCQREILPNVKIETLKEAFAKGQVPTLYLTMDSASYTQNADGSIVLNGRVSVTDGLQRLSAILAMLAEGLVPRFFAEIRLGVDEAEGRRRFQVLNKNRKKVSPNIFIRNAAKDYPGIAALANLCNDRDFVLYKRVSWAQQRTKGQAITVTSLVKIVCALFGRFGYVNPTDSDVLITETARIFEEMGKNTTLRIIKNFFNVCDECWGVKDVAYKDAVWLRAGWFGSFAEVLSKYDDFWNEKSLEIKPLHIEKLKKYTTKRFKNTSFCTSVTSSGKPVTDVVEKIIEDLNTGRGGKLIKITQHVFDKAELAEAVA